MSASGVVTIMAVGDLYISREDPPSIFDGVRAILGQADVLLGNQEGPVTDRGGPILGKREAGSSCFRGVVEGIAAEAQAGFSAVTLANNHIMDYGEEGLLHTIDLLHQHEIALAGAGASLEAAHSPALLRRNGEQIAMLGYTCVFPPAGFAAGPDSPGVATVKVHTSYEPSHMVPYQPGTPNTIITTPNDQEMQAALEDIRRAKRQADVVVVQFHWGVAGYDRVLGYMKELSRAAIDAGADLVLGNHPHRLLGLELYKERLICYSLNHFAFDRAPHWDVWFDAVILKAAIRDGRCERYSVLPVTIDRATLNPRLAEDDRWRAIHGELEALSHEFGTSFTPDRDELVVDGPTPGTPSPTRAPEVLADSLLRHPVFGSG